MKNLYRREHLKNPIADSEYDALKIGDAVVHVENTDTTIGFVRDIIWTGSDSCQSDTIDIAPYDRYVIEWTEGCHPPEPFVCSSTRRIFASMIANKIIDVQPMSIPAGLIFYLDYTCGGDANKKIMNFHSDI